MLSRRNNRGFTMMETLVAVAIVVILMGVAFISVFNYQRSMKQFELDKTARELFVAAQNHLAVAESQGLLSERIHAAEKATDQAAKTRIVGTQGTREGGTYHYFVVGNDYSQLSEKTVLGDMLPSFSIDDTVRLGGSYVIEYNLESATVTNVFYSDKSNLSNHVFSYGEITSLFPAYVGADKSDLRLQGFTDINAIIGWYDGDDAKDLARVTLYAPKVEIINGERLEAKVSFTRNAITRMLRDADTSAKIIVIIKGKTSGSERKVSLSTVSEFNLAAFNEVEGVTAYRSCVYVLDDVTDPDGHFAKKWCTSNGVNSDPALIPGEDVMIRVKVTVTSTSMLANIEEREAGPENSLFGSVAEGEAGILNFRHLENLSPEISGYKKEPLIEEGATPVTKAKQLGDLAKGADADYSWDGFKKAINSSDPESVRVYKLSGNASDASKAGTYLPANPTYQSGSETVHYLTSYNGNGRSIEGVTIDNASDAGLFGTLNNCTVEGLELRDFKVQTSNGNAGALVGSGDGLTVKNVVARNTVADDSAYEITGAASAGGLVGSMNNSTITASAAAVYVKATSDDGSAGGFVGRSTGSSSKIEKSYSGGHTIGGKYLDVTTANTSGRLNVQAQAEAGGLVGKATDGLTIRDCYSTCSAYGGTAGGFVGSMNAGTISNCYATGRVEGKSDGATIGAFAGSLTGGATINTAEGKQSHYFSISNMYTSANEERNVSAIGSDETSTAVIAFDADSNSYNAFVTGAGNASPYDSYLKEKSNGKYPFKNIQELSGAAADTLPTHAKAHYGDWSMPETLFINIKPT